MGTLLRTLLRPIRQPQNAGQAAVVLALGFIGLVGFMGIVTDVSLLLARYNSLSRAVDSAAISAAGQMRSDRSFAEVGLAARMMLELHGINSEEVQVDTCASSGTLNPDPVLCSEANRYRKLVRVGAKINSPTVFLRLLGIQDIELSAVSMSETAVLDIVMVMDVSESMLLDTTYEDWARIGLGQVYVPPHWAGVYSRLGSVGPVNVFQANDTSEDLYPDIIQFWGEQLLGGVRTFPRKTQEEVSRYLDYRTTADTPVPNPFAGDAKRQYKVTSFPYPGYGTQNHPRVGCRVRFWPYSITMPIPQEIRQLPGFANYWEDKTPAETLNINQPIKWGGFVPAYDFYGCCNDPTYGGMVTDDGRLVGIGSNTLDLNQQYGDFQFNDLICQPFKQARDATREFLQTVDFDRGDRVAFVTFDRGAFLIDPDGSEGRDAATNGDNCPRDPAPVGGKTQWTHMLASLCRAERVLDQHIGVRAEPNFYAWKEAGGGWYAFASGRKVDGTSRLVDYYNQDISGGYFADIVNPDGTSDIRNDNSYDEYPVARSCPFQNAALNSYSSLYSLWDWEYNGLALDFGDRFGLAQYAGLSRYQIPNSSEAGWGDISVNESYELWASCRGTNIGAGLREGNNALLDPATTRRTGTVWVMIMLSDGAAGASDPVRINGRKPAQAAPYFDYGVDRANWRNFTDPRPGGITWTNLIRYGAGGEYGAFGLCPIGTPTQRSELTTPEGDDLAFPFCGDEQPETRHFCRPPGENPDNVGVSCPSEDGVKAHGFAPGSFDVDYDCDASFDDNLLAGRVYDVDIGNWPNETAATCDPLYDVDDYARDWADYVALSRTGAGDEQLPTIFTIGFGLNFLKQNAAGYIDPNDDPSDPGFEPYSAEFNIEDFLGEELLRYIADVGDNFALDTDYQQDWHQETELNGSISDDGDTPPFGARGPCEDQTLDPSGYTGDMAALMGNGFSTRDGGNGQMVRPLPPRQDCGNYYNAPDQGRLQLVFDDIASRMFTRLAP